MAALADEWGSPGKDIGLELWRIEKMVPVRQPEVKAHRTSYLAFVWFGNSILYNTTFFQVNGKFYSGDSYILLSTSKSKRYGLLVPMLFFILRDVSTSSIVDIHLTPTPCFVYLGPVVTPSNGTCTFGLATRHRRMK